jgi:hypothetical protein
MTGKAGSAVKVICRIVVVVKAPSVTVKVTAALPTKVVVPEIIPVTGSMLSPAGKPMALILAVGVPPVVVTWNRKNCPGRAVTALLFVIVGPPGGIG